MDMLDRLTGPMLSARMFVTSAESREDHCVAITYHARRG